MIINRTGARYYSGGFREGISPGNVQLQYYAGHLEK